MQIDDIYGRLNWVRQWSLDDAGQPHCVGDALLPSDAGAVAALQRNAAVRAMLAAVEPYEAATRVAEPAGDVPRTLDVADGQGQTTTVANPPWATYDAAQAIVGAASATTLAHALWRGGEPPASDPPSDAWTAWDAARTASLAEFGRLAALPLASDPRPVQESISARQFFQQLAIMGAVTVDEAMAAIKVGAIPAFIQSVLDLIPDDAIRFAAEMEIAGANTFDRHHATTSLLGYMLGKSDAEMDAIWRAGALL